MSLSDLDALKYAVRLAKKGDSAVLPNPRVGAVVLKDGHVICEGWHEKCGSAHAEVHALQSLKEKSEGLTLVVTLEPCHHHGRTPPCTQTILNAGIQKVVFGQRDPSSKGGGGADFLRSKGLEVVGPIRVDGDSDLTETFCANSLHQRAYIHAKWAMSLDGRLATSTGDSKWISNEDSRRKAHELRSLCDGILVGAETFLRDEPRLNLRFDISGRDPRPMVWDRSGRTSKRKDLWENWKKREPIVWTSNIKSAWPEGVQVMAIDQLEELPERLYKEGLYNILIEGGGALLGACHDARIIDQVHVFVAPKCIGGQGAISPLMAKGHPQMDEVQDLLKVKQEVLGSDCFIKGYFRFYHPDDLK